MSGSAWGDDPDDVKPEPVYLDLKMLQPESETGKRLAKGKGKKKPKEDKPEKKPPIPKAPGSAVAIPTGDEVKRGISQRARAAANLKVEGLSFAEIADILEFKTPADAKKAVEGVLAAIHGDNDYETLKLIAAARGEERYRNAARMANAMFFETEDGERIPNTEQLRWEQQAGTALMNWATIVGAKAPAKLEITPGDEEVQRLVQMIAERAGHEEIVDAEVIELEYEPRPPDPEDEDAEEY